MALNDFLNLFRRPKAQKLDHVVLKSEIADARLTTTRSIIGDHPANGLTPERLAQILRSAEDGDADAYLDLAEQMEERDLHYLSVLGTRKRQVSQLPITIDAATDAPEDQRVADFIREWLTRDALESELFDILDAIGKGFSATEIVWNQDGKLWFPDALKYRLPRWFAFDNVTGETPLLKGGYGSAGSNLQGEPLPPAKFIFHLHPAKSGLPIRGGLARPAAWAYLFKNYSLKDWVAFCEIYGRPFRIGKYPAGATPEQIETLMMAVSGMGEDAAAVVPDSMMIELVDSKAQGGDLYDRLLNYLDRQMSKAVLGQTATTDADIGGLGSGKEHGEVRADIERADAKLLSATIQRDLFAPMVRLNFGEGVAIPKLKIGREEEWDAGKMMPAIKTFVDMGGRVEASIIADKLGLPDAPPEAEVLEAAKPPQLPAPGGEPGEAEKRPASARKGPGGVQIPEAASVALFGASLPSESACLRPGEFAQLVGAAVADRVEQKLAADPVQKSEDQAVSILGDHWEEILSPMVDPVVAAVQAAETYEEAIAAMTRALETMDTSALEDAVLRGSLVTRAVENG